MNCTRLQHVEELPLQHDKVLAEQRLSSHQHSLVARGHPECIKHILFNVSHPKFGRAEVRDIAICQQDRTVNLRAIDESSVSAVEICQTQAAADIEVNHRVLTGRCGRRNREIACSIAPHYERESGDAD